MSKAAAKPALEGPVRLEVLDEGAIWRLVLATPKANVIDAAKIGALTQAFQRAADAAELRAIVIEAEGPHFSFGASVEEHLPESCEAMLTSFHKMFVTALEAAVPLLVAVQGQCLGGGLELASFCNRVFAAPDAKLGQPEIMLGVIAPMASAILVDRVGRGAAEDLLLSGRTIAADEAHRIGLVDELADDPRAAALAYAREHLLPKSGSSLRFAVRAARHDYALRLRRDLRDLEALYLDELMNSADAVEGLRAFVEKRRAEWRHA